LAGLALKDGNIEPDVTGLRVGPGLSCAVLVQQLIVEDDEQVGLIVIRNRANRGRVGVACRGQFPWRLDALLQCRLWCHKRQQDSCTNGGVNGGKF